MKTKIHHINKIFDLITCLIFVSICCECPLKKFFSRSDLISSSGVPFRLLVGDVNGLSLRKI